MSSDLLSTADAARLLGISVPTLYGWLSQSDAGEFQLRGEPVTIAYLQTGPKGQGRIKIYRKEVDRLLDLMVARPKPGPRRRTLRSKPSLQHITARLGRPEE